MARWNSYIDDNVGDGSDTIAGIIANGPTYGIGISSDVYVTGIATFTDVVKLNGQLRDGDNAFGTSGQVLSSDGTDTKWINAAQLSAGAASQVAVNDDSNTNAERFITIVDSSSGNNNVKTDASLKYNPSTNTITTVNITGNVTGNVTGNLTGNVTGNASGNSGTATALQNARTIGGVSFNGTANINLPGVNQAGNQNTSGNAATATKLATARNIGGVSFDGSAAINLPGVNQTGNQNTSGNAATATVLETTRNFSISNEITANTQSFNGSGNVTLSATVNDNVIDYNNLKASNRTSATNGQYLRKQSGNIGGMTWEDIPVVTGSNLSGNTLSSSIVSSSLTSLGTLSGLSVNGNVSVTTGAISGNGEGLTNLGANRLSSGTVSTDRLPKQELGISIVGNFGQWEGHGTYTDFNTEPAYWGWNFVQGTSNAPNTTSSQWYRCRLSLGSQYGKGSDGNDYSLEMALPRNNQSSAGGLHIRAIENGSEQSWVAVGSNASLITTGTLPAARLPNHSASLLTSGTIPAARLPNHSASLLTSGTLPTARLSTLPQRIGLNTAVHNTPASRNAFLALGDGDTGVAQNGDGQLELWANNQEIMNLDTSNVTSYKSIIPSSDSSFNIGSSSNRWSNVYADTLHGNGSNLTSVNYNNLTNKPTIPTNNNQLTNGRGFITATDVRSMNEAASTGESSTGSTVYSDKITLSISTVSNSRVLLAYSFEIKHSNTSNHRCHAKVTGSNTGFVGGDLEESRRENSFERFNGTILDISSHTGTRTYRIQWRTSNNTGQIKNASLTAIEMSV